MLQAPYATLSARAFTVYYIPLLLSRGYFKFFQFFSLYTKKEHGFFVLRVLFDRISHLFAKRIAVRIGIDVSGEDQDPLDKAPNRADTAAANGENQLSDRLSGESEIKVMNSPATEKNTEKACRHLGFLPCHGSSRLCRIAFRDGSAAIRAELCTVG